MEYVKNVSLRRSNMVKAKQYGSCLAFKTNGMQKKVLLGRSNIVLLRYLRQIKYRKYNIKAK